MRHSSTEASPPALDSRPARAVATAAARAWAVRQLQIIKDDDDGDDDDDDDDDDDSHPNTECNLEEMHDWRPKTYENREDIAGWHPELKEN